VHYGYPGYSGGGGNGGSVSGLWSLVSSEEILGCAGPMVPLGGWYVWYFGTRGLWYLGPLDVQILSVPPENKKSLFVRFCESFGSPDIS
jgi:hypothetical protein